MDSFFLAQPDLNNIKNDPWFKVIEAFMKTGLVFDSTLEHKRWIKMIKLNDEGIYPAVDFIRHPAIKDKVINLQLGARLSQRMIPVVYGLNWTPTRIGKDAYVYFHFNTDRYKTSYYHRLTLAQTLGNAQLIISRIKEFYDSGRPFVGEAITNEAFWEGTRDPDDHKIREFLIQLYDKEGKDLNELILGLEPWTPDQMK